jgi:hypothetical protein
MKSVDLRELPGPGANDANPVARAKAAFLREVVAAATAHREAGAFTSAVQCILRLAGRQCGARIQITTRDPAAIRWWCDVCGEQGQITGFEGSEADLSGHAVRGRKRMWGFDDEVRKILLDATTEQPALRAVVARAAPVDTAPGLLLLEATVEELDDIYTVIEGITARTRSKRRRELLDALRFSLSTAMDGF